MFVEGDYNITPVKLAFDLVSKNVNLALALRNMRVNTASLLETPTSTKMSTRRSVNYRIAKLWSTFSPDLRNTQNLKTFLKNIKDLLTEDPSKMLF